MSPRILPKIVLILVIIAFGISLVQIKPTIQGKAPEQNGEDQYEFILNNLVGGGPEKDGIPSIDNPYFLNAKQAELQDSLNDADIVFGINFQGQIKAYPKDIMYWHEIVNDNIAGQKISITYCPLTGSVIAYKGHELGVSGKLYNSNLVMYDRTTSDRIPQILGYGIEGELKGKQLEKYPIIVTTWKQWKEKYPNTQVLSRKTGAIRDYDKNPYPGYDELLRVWFPLSQRSNKYKSKELIFGIENNGEYIAVTKKSAKTNQANEFILGNQTIQTEYNFELDTIKAYKNGKEIPTTQMYWFAWFAFHPQTKILETQK